MNRLPVFICFLLLIMGCKQPAIKKPADLFVQNFDTSLKKTGDTWLYQQRTFSGYIIESGRDGSVLYKLPVIAGKEEGQAFGWYNTGEKLLARNFKNGKQDGLFEQWWPNGNDRYLFHYKEGNMDGQQLVFYPNGQKRQESNYLNGIEEGIQRAWNQQGELVSNYTVKNNKLYGVIKVKSCLPVGH
jgi:antitoxin component YwqK of YwqJK toxin-antitoxin module